MKDQIKLLSKKFFFVQAQSYSAKKLHVYDDERKAKKFSNSFSIEIALWGPINDVDIIYGLDYPFSQ